MTCDVKLYRKRQILGKLETGCAEPAALTAADGGVEITVSPEMAADVSMNERDVARLSLTHLKDIPGEIMANFSFSAEFKGSGVAGTPPKIDPFLQAIACFLVKY